MKSVKWGAVFTAIIVTVWCLYGWKIAFAAASISILIGVALAVALLALVLWALSPGKARQYAWEEDDPDNAVRVIDGPHGWNEGRPTPTPQQWRKGTASVTYVRGQTSLNASHNGSGGAGGAGATSRKR